MGKDFKAISISSAPPNSYFPGAVALPPDYGQPSWYRQESVRAIIQTVHENLNQLDRMIGFTSTLSEREVILKPNLVTVFNRVGLISPEYPNTTDPRVIEGVVDFLKQYNCRITIAESSGKGVPTRTGFKLSGLDRLANRHNLTLVALEEEPVNYYAFPRGKIHKEILLPALLEKVLQGGALFFSLPKMKTNLYTEISLGCKNSMGCFPYSFRLKDHNFNLLEKLVDIYSFLPPDLVLIDGIVGGEGQAPGPVNPVDSRLIISGNNCLETDRKTAEIMGFSTEEMPFFRAFERLSPQKGEVKTLGSAPSFSFRMANPSLHDSQFIRLFPQVFPLIGHEKEDQNTSLEFTCRGGCLATTRLGLDFLRFEGLPLDFSLTLIIGSGISDGKTKYYLDPEKNLLSNEQIKALPGTKLAIGSCAVKAFGSTATRSIKGCLIHPNSVHRELHRLTGLRCRMVSPFAPAIKPYVSGRLAMHSQRIKHFLQGKHLDLSEFLPQPTVEIGEFPEKKTLKIPLQDLTWKQRLILIARELTTPF